MHDGDIEIKGNTIGLARHEPLIFDMTEIREAIEAVLIRKRDTVRKKYEEI